MGTGLAAILITVGTALLFSIAIIISNNIIKTQNAKLKIDVNSLSKKLDMELVKNKELIDTLEYIRQTQKIPQKVFENKYEYQNLISIQKTNKIDKLKDKFKVKLSFADEEDLSKEEIEKFIKAQNLSIDKDQNKDK